MFETTSHTLIEKIQDSDNQHLWNASWQRFLRIYRKPMSSSVAQTYRYRTQGLIADASFVEDILSEVYSDLIRKSVARYDRSKGRLSTYLRTIINGKVVDRLRKENAYERPLSLDAMEWELPDESEEEKREYESVLLVEILNSVRESMPQRRFCILERVALNGEKVSIVAKDLGIEPDRVSRELYKAKSKLTEVVKNYPNFREQYYA